MNVFINKTIYMGGKRHGLYGRKQRIKGFKKAKVKGILTEDEIKKKKKDKKTRTALSIFVLLLAVGLKGWQLVLGKQ